MKNVNYADFQNAIRMKRLIPSRKELIDGIKIDFNQSKMVNSILTSAEETYCIHDVINTAKVTGIYHIEEDKK